MRVYGLERREPVTRGGIISGQSSGVGYMAMIMGQLPPVRQTLIVFRICTTSAVDLVLLHN